MATGRVSMPSEMLLKIFSYLDAVSLLSVGCVNKLFYDLANDKFSKQSAKGIDVALVPPNIGDSTCPPPPHFQVCEKLEGQYAPPLNKPAFDDIDPEYGLHDYSLHLEMHGRSCTYLRGTFRNLFCRKGDIANGYLRVTVVSLKDNRKHLPLIGTLGLSWETDVFKGNVKDCYMMNLTLLDEIGEPFWCFSAPVHVELSSRTSGLYDYMGHIYTTNYADSEGKVCVKLIWLEETKEYIIVNLVLYVSTKKVNNCDINVLTNGLDMMNARTTDTEVHLNRQVASQDFLLAEVRL
ncbi:F-box only protein 15 isoform X3 [Pitangus sulphuratus]|nr:F-box only protein 15 isoform X3 [Pitangus sulphuratus]